MTEEFSRMQHHPVQVTEAGARAQQRYFFPASGKDKPHAWIRIDPTTWVFTNDNSINQYKALVHETKQGYTGVVRTLSSLSRGRSPLFLELEDAQAWAAVVVYDLIESGFDFYGPDKVN